MLLSASLKPSYLFTALALTISAITVVTGTENVTGQDGDFRQQLPEVLDLLCPYGKTCRGGEPRLKLGEGMASCCTECSCEDTCGLTESCCYPEQAVLTYFDRSLQQCQVPSTLSQGRKRSEKHFYMVNTGNGNGRRENCGNGNVTCGDNETASVLGSLYPVSSKTTSVIYKNEQCAKCHGVARSDMIPWEVEMTCMLDRDRVDTMLQSLETGRVHNSCWLDYYYPGPQSEVKIHLCYENAMRSCRNNDGRSYKLPSYLNMTDDEVRSACLTGPQAQYRDNYNLFCFLCSNRAYRAEEQCDAGDSGDRASSPGTFSAILDKRFLDNKALAKSADMDAKTRLPPVSSACKRQDGLQIDTDDCRPVLCPSGKVCLGAARKCVYPDKTMLSRTIKVAVELTPGDNGYESPLTGHLKSYLQQDKDWRTFFSAPGLNSWRLSILCYHDDTEKATNNGSSGFFWLMLTLEKTKSSSLAKLLANVNKFMTRGWEFVINMTTVPLEQRFSDFEDLDYDLITKTSKKRYGNSLDPELSCTMFDPPTRSLSIHVTKTFFCDQVALQPEEYAMEDSSRRLYVNATGRVFSPAEYSLGYDASGDPEPRLCLGDTDYVLVPQQNQASPSGAPVQNNWLILALIVFAGLI